MMLTEIARMPVRAYLNGDGSVRVKSCVAAAIAYNGKERPIYWSNAKVVNAIDAYLAYRIAHRLQLTLMATEYRGLAVTEGGTVKDQYTHISEHFYRKTGFGQ
jgi:hypothetical protein